MKLLFFACQQIGVDCIKYAIEKGVEVPAVYTYELLMDKTYGYESVKDFCETQGIHCISNGIIDPKFVQEIGPDMIVSAYFRKLLKPEIFEIPEFGSLNIHPSMLPLYRGTVPTAWALLHGCTKSGVTLHYIDEGTDTGDIIFQEEVAISDDDTGYSLYVNCMNVGVKLFVKMLDMFLAGKNLPRRKQNAGGSYYGSIDSSIRSINWKTSSGQFIVNQARTFRYPYPGLESKLLNKRVLVWKASVVNDHSFNVQKPGKIVGFDGDKILVTCADGLISIDEYEMFPGMTKMERDIYFKVGNYFT